MMDFLRFIFSKKYRKNYSRKILSDYNEFNNTIEKIYKETNTISDDPPMAKAS